MVLGEPELVLNCTGADMGQGGRVALAGPLAYAPLVGLAERTQRSP